MTQEIQDKIDERILGLTYSPDLSQKEVFRAGMMEVINNPAEYLPHQLSDEDIEKLADAYFKKNDSMQLSVYSSWIQGYKAAQQP